MEHFGEKMGRELQLVYFGEGEIKKEETG